MNTFKKVNGWVRLFIWGVCPECNHDAPKLYDCKTCNYYEDLPRYRSQQTKECRNKVWNVFKTYMKGARENDFLISEYGLFGEKLKVK